MKPDFKVISSYDTDIFTLIPLHKWDQTSTRRGNTMYDGKRPLATRWTSIEEQMPMLELKELVERGHNVGVLLRADQVVFDVDPQNYGLDENFDIVDSFKKFCEDNDFDMDDYPVARTGSGGLHIYMSKPADLKHCNQHEAYPGLEFKSKGQQVVAAGSVHPTGLKHYEWINPPQLYMDENGKLPEAHPWILNMFQEAAERRSTSAVGEQVLGPDELEEMLADMDPLDFRDHDSWFELMAALHDSCGGDPACGGVFDLWCQGDTEKYSGDVLFRWDSFDTTKNTRITLGSLKKIVAKKGSDDSQKVLGEAIAKQVTDKVSNVGDDFDDDQGDQAGVPAKKRKRPGLIEALGTELELSKNGKALNTDANTTRMVHALAVQPRLNTLDKQIHFLKPFWNHVELGSTLASSTQSKVRSEIIKGCNSVGFEPSEDMVFRAIRDIGLESLYNPVLDYLDGLEWDGKRRMHLLFGEHFRCGVDEYTKAVSKAFMIGAIARARKPGCKRDEMPVLKGKQGAGKSTGLKILAGEKFFSDADLGKLDSKDAPINLQGAWIHEFAELDGLRDHESSTLKGFLSRGTDKYRPPYERTSEEVPRRSVFVGTCNEGGFLKDATGNRRYWPMTVEGTVNLGLLKRDRDQLWAEADAAYDNGESWFLPESLWGLAAERQMSETTEDPWVEQIRAYLDGYSDSDEEGDVGTEERKDRILTRDLLDFLVLDKTRQTKKMSSKIKVIMTEQLDWEWKNSVRMSKYKTGSGYVRKVT